MDNYQKAYTDLHYENGRDFEELTKEELYHMVYHERITGYYNWNHMWRYFDARHDKIGAPYCSVHFDIKDFKLVNVNFGHEVGNNLLRGVCAQMEKEKKKGWVYQAAKCDNDNFAMIVEELPEEVLIEKLTAFFDSISTLEERPEYHIYYRCGVVTAQDALMQNSKVADLAKFAQRLGQSYNKNDINFYTGAMYEKMLLGKFYLSDLDRAIAEDEFVVFFQPKYDIHTNRIVGAEALVRWNHRHEKMIPPCDFIPVFEENEVIGKVDQVVLAKTCAALAQMKEEGMVMYPVSVNLSRRRIKSPTLMDELCSVIDSYGVEHPLVEFELTESAAYSDTGHLFNTLNNLHDLGFHISMDDFGTGYSSLSLLKNLPLDTLKIDKSFVDSICFENEKARENVLLRDIIYMAKDFGLACVAEGAERKEQVDFLRTIGCDKVQGYYYSRPIPIPEYMKKVREQEAKRG